MVRGSGARDDAPYDVLFEVPHGATSTADFEAFAAQLEGPLPEGLVDFFCVNTDIGAPEVAEATAERLCDAHPRCIVAVVRSRVPRTFIDCNRRIDADPQTFRAGRVTPGVMPWVTTGSDLAFLRERYDRYLTFVAEAAGSLRPDGAMIWLHTYAPRSVGVEVDMDIVSNIREAYASEVVTTWPLRPQLEVISRDLDGIDHAPAGVVDALREAALPRGWTVGDGDTYPMHPSSPCWDQVIARPGRTLCLEIRRDLLADPWEPFAEAQISPENVARAADVVANSIGRWAMHGGVF